MANTTVKAQKSNLQVIKTPNHQYKSPQHSNQSIHHKAKQSNRKHSHQPTQEKCKAKIPNSQNQKLTICSIKQTTPNKTNIAPTQNTKLQTLSKLVKTR